MSDRRKEPAIQFVFRERGGAEPSQPPPPAPAPQDTATYIAYHPKAAPQGRQHAPAGQGDAQPAQSAPPAEVRTEEVHRVVYEDRVVRVRAVAVDHTGAEIPILLPDARTLQSPDPPAQHPYIQGGPVYPQHAPQPYLLGDSHIYDAPPVYNPPSDLTADFEQRPDGTMVLRSADFARHRRRRSQSTPGWLVAIVGVIVIAAIWSVVDRDSLAAVLRGASNGVASVVGMGSGDKPHLVVDYTSRTVISTARLRVQIAGVREDLEGWVVVGSVENISAEPVTVPISAFILRDEEGMYAANNPGMTADLAPGAVTSLDLSLPADVSIENITLEVTLPPDTPVTAPIVLDRPVRSR